MDQTDTREKGISALRDVCLSVVISLSSREVRAGGREAASKLHRDTYSDLWRNTGRQERRVRAPRQWKPPPRRAAPGWAPTQATRAQREVYQIA